MRPSHNPAFNSPGEFRTDSLALAGYIIASKSLPLARIDLDPSGRFGSFVFRDLANRGPELEVQFLSGQALVDPNAYHHQLRTLRREIDARLSRGGNSGQIQNIGEMRNGRHRQR